MGIRLPRCAFDHEQFHQQQRDPHPDTRVGYVEVPRCTRMEPSEVRDFNEGAADPPVGEIPHATTH